MLGISVIVLAILYAGLSAVLFAFQRSLIYFPTPASERDKNEALVIQTGGERVLVSTRLRPGEKALVYFGGNAEDVDLNMPSFSLAFPDHSLYLLHYRGYGGSSGTPSEEALFADGLQSFDQVRREHDELALVGRSLGTGIAVRIASMRDPARLVLITPYDSLQEIAARQFPYVPVRWLLRDKYESWRYAPQVKAATLLIEAERDEIIPRESTELLRTRFGEGIASLISIAGAGHNTVSFHPEYLPLLRRGIGE